MAAGSSAPELFTAIVDTFYFKVAAVLFGNTEVY
jgi:hypothetical protein